MSLTIVALEAGGEAIYAIADKRVGSSSSVNGELINWEFQHDNELKLQKIADNVYLTGGTVLEIGSGLLASLKSINSSVPSQIISQAMKFDRLITPPFGKNKYDSAIIFGIYDDVQLFLWKGEFNGTQSLTFPDNKHNIIEISGGVNGTCDKAIKFFCDKLKANPNNLPLCETLVYAASIDKVISPTYDFVCINRTQKRCTELFSRATLTSDSGKRIVIDGTNNSQVFYDAGGAEVLRIDDDLDTSMAVSPLGGLRTKTPAGDFSQVTGNGMYADGSALQFTSGASGIVSNGSIVGIVKYKNDYSGGISAAVIGIDKTADSDTGSHPHAGYFIGTTQIGAPAIGTFITSASPGQIPNYFYGFAIMTMNGLLPYKPAPGQMITVKNATASTITIYSAVHQIVDPTNANVSSQFIATGKSKNYIFSDVYGYWFEIVY